MRASASSSVLSVRHSANFSKKALELAPERSRLAHERNIGRNARRDATLAHLRGVRRGPRFEFGATVRVKLQREDGMSWKTPKIVEVPVGMEINMYVCATRK